MDLPARIEAGPATAARTKRSLAWLAGLALGVVVLLAALEFLRRQGVDLGIWLANIWSLIAAIPAPFVVVALTFKAAEVSLNAFAWTTVLRASFPEQEFSFRQTLGVVQGGVGIFAVVPPKFGGFFVLGLYRLAFPAIPIMAVLATRIVQGASSTILGMALFLVFTVMTAGIGEQSGYLDTIAAFYESQPLLAVVVTGIVIAVLSLLVHHSRTWARAFAHQITVGGAILKTPRRYALRVVLPTLLAFALRWCVTATLLAAFLIPLSWQTLLKVNVSHGLARSVQVTPGGIGTTQAFDLAMLQGIAPVERIVAYSLSESALLFVFNLAFGLGALLWAFGWERTARFLRLPLRENP